MPYYVFQKNHCKHIHQGFGNGQYFLHPYVSNDNVRMSEVARLRIIDHVAVASVSLIKLISRSGLDWTARFHFMADDLAELNAPW